MAEAVVSPKRTRKVNKLSLSITTIGIVAIAFTLISCSKDGPSNLLIVGMELSYPPFEMTDEQNQPTGISVEMAQALSRELGKDLRIENIPFAGLIPSLRTGKIDLIISSMTRTDERAQSIDFSDSYLDTGLCILLPKSSDAKSIEDIDTQGTTVAVKQGTLVTFMPISTLEGRTFALRRQGRRSPRSRSGQSRRLHL